MNKEMLDFVKKELGIGGIDSVTQSQSAPSNQVFGIVTSKGTYFLKHGPRLKAERDRLVWLAGKLAVPEVIAWRVCNDANEELLTVAIEGDDLSELANKVPKEHVVRWLAEILQTIHGLDINDCPFGVMQEGHVFTHGDACLPNFIFHNNTYQGTIDLGAAGIGDREIDLAATVWSLALNCGQGYGLKFLHAYGMTSATEADELRLIKKYEPSWSGY